MKTNSNTLFRSFQLFKTFQSSFCFTLFSVFVFASVTASARWDLNDVSYLMPLPKNVKSDFLLQPLNKGLKGFLLPEKIISTFPRLTSEYTYSDILKNSRVVAVRIDPCFQMTTNTTPETCQKQIRFVWQIVRPQITNLEQNLDVIKTETVDAAFHSFYKLSDAEFNQLQQDILNWKKTFQVQTENLPLQIHPAWAATNSDLQSLMAFNEILKKYVGQQNLVRVTAMTMRNLGQTWGFLGFDISENNLASIQIPRTGRLAQVFLNQANPANQFLGQISPSPESDNTFNLIMTNSNQLLKSNSTNKILESELNSVLNIENPKLFNPNNMDCVSCHVAQAASTWATKNNLTSLISWNDVSYKNANYNLKNTTIDQSHTQNIRAFGYYNSSASISQRVINESAEIAEAMNKLSPL